MPENEAPIRAFYDHETEEPRATGRRRRQVADWGVGEDVFDRLPSRRFARAERRGEDTHEHRHAPRAEARRDQRAAHDDRGPSPREELGRPVREPAQRPRRRPAADWLEEVSPREPAPVGSRTIVVGGAGEDELVPAPARRTIVVGGAVEDELLPAEDAPPARPAAASGDVSAADGAPRSRRTVSAADEAPRSRRTVSAADEAPRPRRTVVIGGHPDRLPAPRPRRPPRTALERVGTSPDRLAAYAVALGLLLILIAVLTTSH